MSIEEMEEKEWRQLCERVSKESDPRRLSKLLDQLLKRLDARREALNRRNQDPESGSANGDK